MATPYKKMTRTHVFQREPVPVRRSFTRVVLAGSASTVLTCTSDIQFGEARVATAVAIATVYLVHTGHVRLGDTSYPAPCAFVATAREYERYARDAGLPAPHDVRKALLSSP